jgi:hypothetical protein
MNGLDQFRSSMPGGRSVRLQPPNGLSALRFLGEAAGAENKRLDWKSQARSQRSLRRRRIDQPVTPWRTPVWVLTDILRLAARVADKGVDRKSQARIQNLGTLRAGLTETIAYPGTQACPPGFTAAWETCPASRHSRGRNAKSSRRAKKQGFCSTALRLCLFPHTLKAVPLTCLAAPTRWRRTGG